VEVIASLPCYTAQNVAKQRGNGVFEKSISALRKLNAVGYGTRLPLNLVYNPLGPQLPGPQAELEADYKESLGANSASFSIAFLPSQTSLSPASSRICAARAKSTNTCRSWPTVSIRQPLKD